MSPVIVIFVIALIAWRRYAPLRRRARIGRSHERVTAMLKLLMAAERDCAPWERRVIQHRIIKARRELTRIEEHYVGSVWR